MKYLGNQFRRGLVAGSMAVFMLVSPQSFSAVKLSLSGMGDPADYGFGSRGLFLGGHFSSYTRDHEYTNWSWSDLEMEIAEDGNATISGNMTRDYNSEVWGINIQLSDIEFKRPNSSYKRSGNWGGNVNQQTFLDLAQGVNPFTGNDRSHKTGWGFEWQSLSMTLDRNGNNSTVPEEGWEGFAMPGMGHPLVAELHYDGSKGLTFEAWYKNPTTNSWYDVGDTKALATVESSEVPEPVGLLLMSLGLVGVRATRRKNVLSGHLV